MKLLVVLSLFTFFQNAFLPAQDAAMNSAEPDAIVGEWFTSEKSSIVKIYKSGGTYYGQIIWLKVPIDNDGNVQKDRRGVPIVGSTILSNLSYNGNGKWTEGLMYVGPRGSTYKCIARLINNDKLEVRVTMDMGITKVEHWAKR